LKVALVQQTGSFLHRSLQWLERAVLALLLVVVAGVVYFVATEPVGYQKLMSLRVGSVPEPDWAAQEAPFDADRVIGSIPYRGSSMLALVLPADLYAATILEGLGNCANKVRGLSYYLEQRDLQFQRIDLLPVDGYLRGSGHVLIRTRYLHNGTDRIGLIDVLDGGIPSRSGIPLDLAELREAPPFTVSITPLNARCDRQSDYYGTFLDSVVVATAESKEIRGFFRWLESVYVPFGNPRVERVVYNATAIVLMRFPSSYVSQEDYDKLVNPNWGAMLIAQTMTWSVRVLLALLPLFCVLHVVQRVRIRKKVAVDGAVAAAAA
jgi:hypothetical protein